MRKAFVTHGRKLNPEALHDTNSDDRKSSDIRETQGLVVIHITRTDQELNHVRLKCICIIYISSYLTGNTLCLCYIAQEIKTV
jgi:hypothetical protein